MINPYIVDPIGYYPIVLPIVLQLLFLLIITGFRTIVFQLLSLVMNTIIALQPTKIDGSCSANWIIAARFAWTSEIQAPCFSKSSNLCWHVTWLAEHSAAEQVG